MKSDSGPLERAAEIYSEACALEGRSRARYLDLACGSDANLRAEIESMLAAQGRQGRFLNHPTGQFLHDWMPATGDSAKAANLVEEAAGTVIGPYMLLERIGEGGFGSVYMAEQEHPIRRKVALKIIKLGMDTKQVIARFEAERQALAMMDHPNIARVFDAGATESGRPYFVMELVHGVPITAFCDENRLTVRQRLDLFVEVCHAVQHAHQKGIIHRDLKPSNVLVADPPEPPLNKGGSEQNPPLGKGGLGGVGVPKVIDFGIAKATAEAGRLTEKTLLTEIKQFIGTPEYMSPEQAQMSGIDVDTRSDVYSLGVLLYELLTGVTPFDREKLRSSSLDDVRRIIREVEPPKPSTRLTALLSEPPDSSGADSGAGLGPAQVETRGSSSSAVSIAYSRHTDPPALTRQLRGELDWIVMKCLEKDRTRRYETANGLAADVQRHLSGEPIVAAPPSKLYRLRKTLRRYRFPIAFVSTLGIMLLLATAISVTFWRRAERESQTARDEADKAEQINDFLQTMLASLSPERVEGRDVTLLLEVLDEAAGRIDSELHERPEVQAALHTTIGRTYRKLGRADVAEKHLRAALAIRRSLAQGDDPAVGEALHDLVRCLTYPGSPTETDARALSDEALELRQRLYGEDHLLVAESLYDWYLCHEEVSWEEAENVMRRVLQIRTKWLGEESSDVAQALMRIGETYLGRERYVDAEPYYRRAWSLLEQSVGKDDRRTIETTRELAGVLVELGRCEEALALAQEAVERCRKLLPPEHSTLGGTLMTLGRAHLCAGDPEQAEPFMRDGLRIKQMHCPPGHFRIARAQSRLGECLTALNQFEEAESLLLEGFTVMEGAARYAPSITRHIHQGLQRIVQLYETWDAAEPDQGYAERAADWREKLQAYEVVMEEAEPGPPP